MLTYTHTCKMHVCTCVCMEFGILTSAPSGVCECVSVCVCVCVDVCVCVCACVCVCMCVALDRSDEDIARDLMVHEAQQMSAEREAFLGSTYMHPSIHPSIHASIHACMHASIHACIHASIHIHA